MLAILDQKSNLWAPILFLEVSGLVVGLVDCCGGRCPLSVILFGALADLAVLNCSCTSGYNLPCYEGGRA